MESANKRRILILTADYGFGHRAASNAIQAALQYQYHDQVVTEIVNPIDDKSAPSFLRKEQDRYDKRVRETPRLYHLGYEIGDLSVTTSVVESTLIVMLYDAVRKILRNFQPDAIITTYPMYLAPLSSIFTIKQKRIPLLTVVTDMGAVQQMWFNPVSDRTLVPTEIVRDLAIKHSIRPETIRITGIPVHPNIALENRSKAELRSELGWDVEKITVLVVGSKRVRNLKDTLQALNHSGLPIQMVVVAGGDNELFHYLESKTWHIDTHIYNRVDNIPTMMHASDTIVCKAGGLITSEALACGLPILFIDVIQGQETGNAEIVIGNGAGELAENPLHAQEILYHWFDNDRQLLHERAQNAARLGNPRSSFDISELAWEDAGRGQIVIEKPLLDLQRLKALLNRFDVPWLEDTRT
jgi:1,2-diacylglycerol 3-beta-galactosyltransferase